jgi:hypothetical protein
MSPHLHAHLCQTQSLGKSFLWKSQRSSEGTWQSTKLHDKTTYVYAFFTQIVDPSFVFKALSSKEASQWRQAMETKYNSLIKNNTWILVDCPPISLL